MNYKPGVILGGKYKIICELGGGAMGKLFKGENVTIHKPVAIKVMHGDYALNDEYKQRFMREARSAASLDHINICSVIDFDMTDDGDAYLVMELLSGETLGTRLARSGALSPLSACLIMRQLLSALGCAHAKGIVHRDIKPDNVFLVCNEERDDFVKLIDFGVAHIEHPEQYEPSEHAEQDEQSEQSEKKKVEPLTQFGQVYGTPQYLSPEQANADPIDYRADLYAAGIIFYEMLVGETPFDGKSCLELLIKQTREPAPHLPSTIAQYELLDGIIQRLLQKKPEDRFQSAAEVMSAIDNIIVLFTAENPLLSPPALAALSGSISVNMKKASAVQAAVAEPGDAPGKTNDAKQNNPVHKLNLYKSIILIGGIVVTLIILTGLILYKVSSGRDDGSDDMASADASQVVDAVAENAGDVPPPQPYNTSNDKFTVSDSVLSADNTLLFASGAFLNEKYEDTFNALNKVKGKYWNHPNFVRLYLLSSTAAQKTQEEYQSLAHLLAIEPLAAVNPGVAKISYELFDDKEQSEKLGNVIVQEQGLYSKTAMAWMIIKSNYDANEQRIYRMTDVYDRLNSFHADESGATNETPAWMLRAVTIWRLSKKECKRRMAMLKDLSEQTAYREEIYDNLLIPLSEQQDKNCIARRHAVDCNACLRSWLDETVNQYKSSGEQPKQGAVPADGASGKDTPKADPSQAGVEGSSDVLDEEDEELDEGVM